MNSLGFTFQGFTYVVIWISNPENKYNSIHLVVLFMRSFSSEFCLLLVSYLNSKFFFYSQKKLSFLVFLINFKTFVWHILQFSFRNLYLCKGQMLLLFLALCSKSLSFPFVMMLLLLFFVNLELIYYLLIQIELTLYCFLCHYYSFFVFNFFNLIQ